MVEHLHSILNVPLAVH